MWGADGIPGPRAPNCGARSSFKQIFGKDAPQVEGGFAKVNTLDGETTRKIFGKILPRLLS
jgi:hypothetical protein